MSPPISHKIIFFFQAEDGIRDIGVTGVQTCALPISPPSLFTFAFCLFTFDLPAEAADGVEEVGGVDRLGQEVVEAGGARPLAVVVHGEIGRASGRGRGEVPGVAGSFKKKNNTFLLSL